MVEPQEDARIADPAVVGPLPAHVPVVTAVESQREPQPIDGPTLDRDRSRRAVVGVAGVQAPTPCSRSHP